MLKVSVILIGFLGSALGQRSPSVTSPIRDVVQSSLIAAGSTPFHLKASITSGRDASPYGEVEMYWLAPDRYQRTIVSKDFSQTLVVNGTKVFEKDSSDYFPLQLRTFVTAMVDPQPILDAVRPGDQVLTKANGAVNESGVRCFGPNGTMCVSDTFGMREVVAASGHGVAFADYQPFEGKRIARVLTNASRLGEEPMMLRVKQLERLDEADSKWLEMPDVTSPQGQMRFLTRSESELRAAALTSQEII